MTAATSAQLKCEHASFLINGRVGRLSKDEGGPITGYTVDVTVKCTDCDLPFRFIGGKPGSSPFEPRVSADALELRAPLEPAIITEILGHPLMAGTA